MFGHERRQTIVSRARRIGRVSVRELASDLHVTTETIRRDLKHLEQRGLIRRVHGGAVSVDNAALEPEVQERSSTMVAEKKRIVRRAVDELPSGGAVYIDAGTTTAAFADLLPADRHLTIVTNSLLVALSATNLPNYRILLVGGEVRATTLATVGSWTNRQLEDITVDVAFIATNGVTVERGLTTPNNDEAAAKRQAIFAATRVVLLADSTKIGREYFERFCRLEDIDLFITDTGADLSDLRQFHEAGINVVTV